ncbi:MAG: SDR family oxidoreductase, partial [Planctomycetota bacterium]
MNRPQGTIEYHNEGRSVLVSGGANGIGRSICEHFHASGASVYCMDVDQQAANELPDGIVFLKGDTSREADCEAAVLQAFEDSGGLDVLVNNAAIQPPESYVPLDELSEETWNKILGVNFSGYTFLAKHAVRVMKRQQSGVIVNIASGQAHRTARQVACYGPIKAG